MKNVKLVAVFLSCSLSFGSMAFSKTTGLTLSVDTVKVDEERYEELENPTAEMLAFEEEFQRERFARLTDEAYREFIRKLD